MCKLSLALFLIPLGLCNAQGTPPSADAILNRFVEATGGRAALEKIHNQVQHGTVEISAMGLKGNITIYEAEPNKNLSIIDIQGVGKIEQGSDGAVAWENNPLQGPRVKQGLELTDALRDGTFNAILNPQKLYSKIETAGSETVEGHDCYKVVLTPSEGNPTTEYYDKQTGLRIKTSATRSTSMGDVTADVLYDDYRKEGDVVMPHKLKQHAAQVEAEITVEKVETNVELPKDVFDLPPDVQALVKKAPQTAASAPAPSLGSAPGSGKLTVYMAGKPTESETYTVEKSGGKIMLNGSGHAAIGPMKVDIDEFNIVTDEKFQPLQADAKGKMGQIQMNVKTTFAAGKATNEVNNGQGTQTKEDDVHADDVVVYNPFPFYPWTVLAMRAQLKNQDPQQFNIYVLNQGEVPATVIFKGREPVEFADKTVELNHIVASGKTPQGQPLTLDFWVDDNRKLIKIAVPSQGVEGYQEGYDRKAPPPTAAAPKPPAK
jgi:hypothetical protein